MIIELMVASVVGVLAGRFSDDLLRARDTRRATTSDGARGLASTPLVGLAALTVGFRSSTAGAF